MLMHVAKIAALTSQLAERDSRIDELEKQREASERVLRAMGFDPKVLLDAFDEDPMHLLILLRSMRLDTESLQAETRLQDVSRWHQWLKGLQLPEAIPE